MVKYVYDKIQEAYDGRWDDTSQVYVDARTTFFNGDELYELAREYEARQIKLDPKEAASG